MKICVLFPGIGYTTELPLMYYSGKMALEMGYDLVKLSYHDLPSGIKGNSEKKKEAFHIAFHQSVEQLEGVDWSRYDEILFVGKSIGTIIAAKYGQMNGLNELFGFSDNANKKIKYIFLTPLVETYDYIHPASGIAFHGNADPWAETDMIVKKSDENDIPLYIYEGANHSLETGDIIKNIEYAGDVMQKIRDYITEI